MPRLRVIDPVIPSFRSIKEEVAGLDKDILERLRRLETDEVIRLSKALGMKEEDFRAMLSEHADVKKRRWFSRQRRRIVRLADKLDISLEPH